ncbi:hypothetical protein K7432_004853 [Basidiobolus ranarum]|uniref:Uncharacterized protein n=1 Tax=Basidiobolus ranarum TaxID=34480 RepID=A0ABR2W4E2_9FUNG
MIFAKYTSLALLLSLSGLCGHANGLNLANTIKQQVFNIIQSTSYRPRSHFADGIYNPNLTCRSAILEAEKKYPKLSQCYSQMPLFFSSLNEVCDQKCFHDTVGAAQTVSESCGDLQLSSNSQRVYYSWADNGAATVACRKSDGVYCLSKVIRANVALENSLVKPVPTDKEKLRKEICLPCTEDFYKAVKKPGQEPVLYYYQIMHPERLFSAFEQYCGYTL